MDFGVPGLDWNTVPENGKLVGSGFPKLERSFESAEDQWKCCKFQKSDDFSTPKTMPLHQGTPLLRSNFLVSADSGQQEHMLSFSSLKSEVPFVSKDDSFLEISTQNSGYSYYQHSPSTYSRNAGYGSGSLNANMHGAFNGARGAFTPSQWIELEHQALIYKYITSNVAVPSNLIIPLKKSLYPFGFTTSSAGSLPPNSWGWGSFHLGYSGSTDPEPGRCRRTDGKKWRCSRDAVAEEKYCERHINRGRHRSRKPVEGQTGHAASGTTKLKVVPMSSPISASVKTGGGASSSLVIAQQQQFKKLQSGATNHSSDTLLNRIQDPRASSVMSYTASLKSVQDPRASSVMSSAASLKSVQDPRASSVMSSAASLKSVQDPRASSVMSSTASLKSVQDPRASSVMSSTASLKSVQDPWASSVMSSTASLKSSNSTFTIMKQGFPYAESSESDFGHVSFDSLVNLSYRSSNVDSKEYSSFLDFTTDQETQDQNLLRRFIDEWPKEESIHSVITWPGELRSDWTQLSMSIPMTSSEFSSSSSSPAQEKLALSPREFDPIQIGSVVNSDISHRSQNQAHWIPISWGSSMGDPLGEVLTNSMGDPLGEVLTNSMSNGGSFKNSSVLSLLSEGCLAVHIPNLCQQVCNKWHLSE